MRLIDKPMSILIILLIASAELISLFLRFQMNRIMNGQKSYGIEHRLQHHDYILAEGVSTSRGCAEFRFT